MNGGRGKALLCVFNGLSRSSELNQSQEDVQKSNDVFIVALWSYRSEWEQKTEAGWSSSEGQFD